VTTAVKAGLLMAACNARSVVLGTLMLLTAVSTGVASSLRSSIRRWLTAAAGVVQYCVHVKEMRFASEPVGRFASSACTYLRLNFVYGDDSLTLFEKTFCEEI
jgi:hypothetical protein